MSKSSILNRQLKHFGLDESEVPKDLSAWKSLLSRIEQTYSEFEQDHYTNERTLMIVSKELQELFESLENAEQIAGVGHWTYNIKTNKVNWSTQMFRIFKRNPILGGLDYWGYNHFVFPEDRKTLGEIWQNAIVSGGGESIHRLLLEKEIRWVHAKFRRMVDENNNQTDILAGTLTDITQQKESELKLAELNSQLISAAKRAGMAEVATSVLHNIGNVLNSLSISSETVSNIIANSKVSNLQKISEMLSDRKDNLGHYLTTDPKGKIIPEYIANLALYWMEEKNKITQNLDSLRIHIQHIKEIVAKQQSISGFLGVMQSVLLSDLVDDAISIVFSDTGNINVTIQKDYQFNDKVLLDKVSILQMLVNLVRNAKDSLDESPSQERIIKLGIERNNSEKISVIIKDTGVGIDPANFKKLFGYGFTTKKTGSGIGLHATILSIREMGGDLKAYSDGVGKGAKFILEIPHKPVT